MNKSLIEEKKKCLLIGYSSPKMQMYNTGVWTASSDTDSITCSAVSFCFFIYFLHKWSILFSEAKSKVAVMAWLLFPLLPIHSHSISTTPSPKPSLKSNVLRHFPITVKKHKVEKNGTKWGNEHKLKHKRLCLNIRKYFILFILNTVLVIGH